MPPADQRLRDALDVILGPDADSSPDETVRGSSWVAAYPDNWMETGKVDYLYREHTILVRTPAWDQVKLALLGTNPDDERRILPLNVGVDTFSVIGGVTGVMWSWESAPENEEAPESEAVGAEEGSADQSPPESQGPPPSNQPPDLPMTPNVLERLDAMLGVGVATPDHVLALCPNGHPCPASEPEEVPSRTVNPVPAVSSGVCCADDCSPERGWDGEGVLVGIVDNGILPAAVAMHPWLAGVEGEPENPFKANGFIKNTACHGTFVAGCVRCTAPKADVIVKRAPLIQGKPDAGVAYEHVIAQKMSELLDLGPDIIVCEYDGESRLHIPLTALDVLYESRIRPLKGVVVLAPAGNDETRAPTFPAAHDWVIAVGALTANGRARADFSNYGGWVDVYAPGEDLVNAFASGPYRCIEHPHKGERRNFDGMAKWSGTSFSTPLVAGMIAARMSATGENAPRAAEALLRFARRQAIPGVGPILLPDQVCCDADSRCPADCSCHEKHHHGHHGQCCC